MNEIVSMSKERFAKYCEDNSTFEESISRIINHYFLLLGNKANILQEREFNNEVEEKKFKNNVKRFETLFPAAAKNAFLKGYQLCLEFVHHPETHIPEELYTDSNLIKDIPFALVNASEFELYEIIRTDETQEFSVFAIRTFEGIRPLLEQVFCEIAFAGAECAFEHERLEKGLELVNGDTTTLTKVPVDRLFAITPSVNGVVVHAEEHCEIWNLTWNSGVTIDNPFIELAEVTFIHQTRDMIQKSIEDGVLYYRILYLDTPLNEIQDRLEIRIKLNSDFEAPRPLEQVEVEYILNEIFGKIHQQAQIPIENMILIQR
ncbi:hypothetical protein EXW39_28355 (plasmid) [Bacillus mycoides]|uniref:PXO1-50 n=1 Tax=Bacillus cereus VD048 TaxID=1053226 RepID=J8HGH6_BACCE|nr:MULTISPECIES: hypothetical protein [Bacillus cereus group]AZJ24656.1 hypothetical protein CT694_35045 [Bacillus wiedmannii bv. thuringiensis]EJR26798.1 hypothetical protein IIG_05121 [Bacillus cereus VD048]QWG81435.1 hypothetical protein EXW27_28485 [Bacillus mycoides]QWH64011.1 hypothetical protein EXW39_28355 [Bacillus mycoides]QWI78438.1 hypothetical protein JG486_30825 [Bacillus mycoides]